MAGTDLAIVVRQGRRSKEVPYQRYYRQMQAIFDNAAQEASQAYDPGAAFTRAAQREIQNWGKDVLSQRSRSRRRMPVAA